MWIGRRQCYLDATASPLQNNNNDHDNPNLPLMPHPYRVLSSGLWGSGNLQLDLGKIQMWICTDLDVSGMPRWPNANCWWLTLVNFPNAAKCPSFNMFRFWISASLLPAHRLLLWSSIKQCVQSRQRLLNTRDQPIKEETLKKSGQSLATAGFREILWWI